MSLARAVDSLSQGRPIVVGGRESTLVMAAQLASPESIARMVRHTSGILRCAADAALLDRLDHEPMVGVDAAYGGDSAAGRARTLRVLADRGSRPGDLVRPGHVFPVRVADDGRATYADAGVQLVRLAGLRPAAVVAELVADDGSLATAEQARRFATVHDLEFVSLEDLRHAVLRLAGAQMPTRYGEFRAEAFATLERPDRHHLAFVRGDPAAAPAPLVRVHAACPAGERFGSLLCDCARQLRHALRDIAAAGAGVLIYLRGDERVTALDTCARRGAPVSTLDAEWVAAAILHALGVRRLVGHAPAGPSIGV